MNRPPPASGKANSPSDLECLAREATEQLAEAWSKLLTINLQGPVKLSGLLPHVATLVMEADVKREKWEDLVSRAVAGDRAAESAVCFGAATFIHRGELMPAPVAEFAKELLMKKSVSRNRRRGGDPHANAFRDQFIKSALYNLKENFGILPTRSEATKDKEIRISGSAIVSGVLQSRGFEIEERGVEEVWGKREKLGTLA